ncbi:MAG TPA: Y-family DNA polymerase [Candidatus Saccharimonadales bacterium]|nr:Y-family DNA polymerase [Candidatus Saccharimonadales bacterium]
MPSNSTARKQPVFALVDCDNFFVSCEQVFRPDLWNRPVAVLSNNDGCIVARSNEVKAMGIPMAAPYFKFKNELDRADVTLFSANFQLYGDFSQRTVRILEAYTPQLEVYSVDESFLEISNLLIDDYTAWALELHRHIKHWLGVPVSIGVAPTKTLAKAAAEWAKHHPELGGAYSIAPDAVFGEAETDGRRIQLLKGTQLKDIWGVGWRLGPMLRDRGLSTAYDLSLSSEKWARQAMSIRGLRTVKELQGEAHYQIEDDSAPQKQMAVTRTFPHKIRAYSELEARIATFSAIAAHKLRRQRQISGAVLVFLAGDKHNESEAYRRVTTVVPLLQATSDTGTLIKYALQGLDALYDPDFSYKRAGVMLLDLSSERAKQLSWLIDESPLEDKRRTRLMQTVDAINEKYHSELVWHAAQQRMQAGPWRKALRKSPAYTTRWADLPRVSPA